ncbi:N-acetyltransferase [Paenibacillus sp. N3/727]|uniref:N-acetyltransferase n=1 Tax=Paenibacillus sp. N3/727 TaxID=2925845 RepID=UPI001F539D0C|nr:N-acetyltransferase [Paenibacillus sp. N3/727]UNK19541.1 N-acetyltransferase [Paenibacillus sp. N3/727]
MNIRLFQNSDTERAVDIWLEGSLRSHPFIDSGYWEAQKEAMASLYLPSSTTFVLEHEDEDNDTIIGFVSLIEQYIAALFIDVNAQNRGYGGRLLDHIKKERDSLHLKVYQKNESATQFYKKNGFYIVEESVDPETSESEYVMKWERES